MFVSSTYHTADTRHVLQYRLLQTCSIKAIAIDSVSIVQDRRGGDFASVESNSQGVVASRVSKSKPPDIEIEPARIPFIPIGYLHGVSISIPPAMLGSSGGRSNSSISVGFLLAAREADVGGPLTTRFLDIVRDNGEADTSDGAFRPGVQIRATAWGFE